jgi:hypothetical protein
MSSVVSSKIRDLKTTIDAQNEMIVTLRQDKRMIWETMSSTYQNMIKYRPEFAGGRISIETADYPDIRNEDLTKLSPPEVVKRFNDVFKVLVMSLQENRDELRSIFQELDNELDESLDKWNQIRVQADNEKKSEAFRANLVNNASSKRSGTPDLVANGARDNFGPTLPPTPPSAPGKKEPIQPISTGKSKSGTTTLESMLSPTSGKTTSAKDKTKK